MPRFWLLASLLALGAGTVCAEGDSVRIVLHTGVTVAGRLVDTEEGVLLVRVGTDLVRFRANEIASMHTFPSGTDPDGDAIALGVAWLLRHQAEDGGFRAADFDAACGSCSGDSFAEPANTGPGRGNHHYDAGVTALALLALHRSAPVAERDGRVSVAIERARTWLTSRQDASGGIGVQDVHGESIYNHALATLALAELLAAADDPGLRKTVRAATEYIVQAQNPGLGWKYGVQPGKNDTSVTAWMVAALHAAREAEIEVPPAAFDSALRWFERATAASGDVGYQSPGGGSSYVYSLKQKLGREMYDQVPITPDGPGWCSG